MNRRTLLATCASTGLTATAGCLGRFRPGSADETSDENADELEGYVRPDHEPEVRPPELECERVEDDEYERHPPRYQDIQLGGMENFSLRVTDLAFEYGDTAEITLRNDTSETKQRGRGMSSTWKCIQQRDGRTFVSGLQTTHSPIQTPHFLSSQARRFPGTLN